MSVCRRRLASDLARASDMHPAQGALEDHRDLLSGSLHHRLKLLSLEIWSLASYRCSMSGKGIGHFFVWVIVLFLASMFLFNGAVMLISPRTWFRLPSWLAGHGTMTERKYDSRSGRLQVRMLGAIFIGVVAYVVIDILRGL